MATDLTGYAEEGTQEYLDGKLNKPSGIPSSSEYDAKLIAWHVAYHAGIHELRAVSTGRGHSYNVTLRGGRKSVCRITDYTDHRFGVQGLL